MSAADTNQRALIICGPALSGKTTLARQLASARGPFREIHSRTLDDKFTDWLLPAVPTFIVKDLPESKWALEKLKTLVSNESFRVDRMGLPCVEIKTPAFILVTEDTAGAKALQGRRFAVRELKP